MWRSTAISKGVLWSSLGVVVQHNQTQLHNSSASVDDEEQIKFEEFGAKWEEIQMLDLRSKVGYGNDIVQGVDD